MPQWRKLHAKVVESVDVNDMPDDFARLLWVLLPTQLCCQGRGQDNPAWIRAKVFPLRQDVTLDMVEGAMTWYAGRGMLLRYQVGGRPYFQLTTWTRYQGNTSREAPSDYPPPDQAAHYSHAAQQECLPNSSPVREPLSQDATHARCARDKERVTNSCPDADAEGDANTDTDAHADADSERGAAAPALSAAEGPVLSSVEGPVLSSVEGPVLSPVEGPAPPAPSLIEGSPVEGPVLSPAEGPVPPAPSPIEGSPIEGPSRKPKSPPAVLAFRRAAHRYPPKSWYADVDRIVGREEADLQFWEGVVKEWVGHGWNPTNVSGMLECYQRRQLPGRGPRAGGPPADPIQAAIQAIEEEGWT